MQNLDTAIEQASPGGRKAAPQLRLAQQCMDLSLLAIFFLAPLVLGGRHPVGELALIVAALPGTLGVAIKIFSGGVLPLSNRHWLVLAACLLIPLIQIAPVAVESVQRLAPGVEHLLGEEPLLGAASGPTTTLSVSAANTRKSLPLLVAYLCVFTFLTCRLESRKDVEWILTLLVGSALLLTVLALLQAAWGNDRFVWLYDHPSRLPGTVPRGPFQNENHLSSLLATVLPCMLYFLFRDAESKTSSTWRGLLGGQYKRWMAAIGCVVIVLTVYATPSRGGAAMIAFAAAVWGTAWAWSWIGSRYVRRIGHTAWMRLGLGLGTLCALVGMGVLFGVAEKYSYARAKLWAADFAIWKDFPILGIGVGNHRHVYRAYLGEYFPDTFSTAESSLLQLLVETGAVGIGVLIVVMCVIFAAVLRTLTAVANRERLLLGCAVLAGLAASCVHASGDFPWHIPACVVVVLTLAACAIRMAAMTATPETAPGMSGGRTQATVSSLVVLLLLVGNLWAISKAIPDARASLCWDDYRRLANASSGAEQGSSNEQAIALLRETLRHDPYHVQARAKLVYRLTSEFEHKRFQLQDPDRQAKQILAEAASLAKMCPTESRNYMCAAVAAAALGATPAKQQQLLEQASRLRLVDAQVSLRRGLLALMLQDEEQTTAHLEDALNADPSFREHAVKTLSMLFTPEQMVQRFDLSLDTLVTIYRGALNHPDAEQPVVVGRYYCQRLWEHADSFSEPSEIDLHLLTAFDVARRIGDEDWKMKIVSRRLELFPRNVELLLARVVVARKLGLLEQARDDLARCLSISPNDARVRRLAYEMDRASRLKLR